MFLARWGIGTESAFPLRFSFDSVLEGSGKAAAVPFMVAAMFTRGYADRAARLRASCERLGLPYALYETRTVHNSISAKGTPDLHYTKANFIRFLLERYRRPVLYVDADCVFRHYPRLIGKLLEQGTTFAIYNWAADPKNEAFVPIEVSSAGETTRNRYYGYFLRVNCQTQTQLKCSGAVQLYANTPASFALLERWHKTVQRFPGCADDNCLNFAFNNGGSGIPELNASWLPKSYARYAWWIYVRPIIDHPDPRAADAASQFVPIPATDGEEEFYQERTQICRPRFSENAMIDVEEALLYNFDRGRFSLVGPAPHQKFWVG